MIHAHSVARTVQEHVDELDLLREDEPTTGHDDVRPGYHCADLRFVGCDCREEHK